MLRQARHPSSGLAMKLFFIVGGTGVLLADSQQTLLPGGEGRTIVERACLSCHESDLIVQQRLSRTQWEREVEKMLSWGAPVEDKDRQPLIDYLARMSFESLQTSAAENGLTNDAEELLRTRCLTCHEDDLIRQQRLNKAGWTREVEKMVRWGAELTEQEKSRIIECLARRKNQPRKSNQ